MEKKLKEVGTIQVRPGEKAYLELIDSEGRATGVAFCLGAAVNPEVSKNSIEYAVTYHSERRCETEQCRDPIVWNVITPTSEVAERRRNEAVARELAEQDNAEFLVELAKSLGLSEVVAITESGERTIKVPDFPPSD